MPFCPNILQNDRRTGRWPRFFNSLSSLFLHPMRPRAVIFFIWSISLSLASNPSKVVPKCAVGETKLVVDQKSDGSGLSKSKATVALCYSLEYLQVTYDLLDQKYLPQVNYTNCDDPVYNSDVAEIFVGPYPTNTTSENPGTHCYMEVDFSPYGTPFQSGIYNPNLNHSGIVGTPLNCSSSGIDYQVTQSQQTASWSVQVKIPWSLIDCVPGCPSSGPAAQSDRAERTVDSTTQITLRSTADSIIYTTASSQSEAVNASCSTPAARGGSTYYLNFYRINELTPVASCTAATCEYLAWSPTYANPPAFHEPLYFGTILLE